MRDWLVDIVRQGMNRALGSPVEVPPPPPEPFRGRFHTQQEPQRMSDIFAHPRVIHHGNTTEERARERRGGR